MFADVDVILMIFTQVFRYVDWPLRAEYEEQSGETHPHTGELPPRPHKERRQGRHHQHAGEAPLNDGGVISEDGSERVTKTTQAALSQHDCVQLLLPTNRRRQAPN